LEDFARYFRRNLPRSREGADVTSSDLLSRARELRSARTPFVLATVVRARRPTSAKAGDSALVLPDGTIDGFVGGSCAESTVRLEGLRALSTGESVLLRITPSGPADVSDGLVTVANPCLSGGELEIFLEAMVPPPLVLVWGSAPVARALAEVGAAVGYDVRPAGLEPDPDAAAVVVASHGRDEEPVLVAALRAGVPYVALVASRRRAAGVLASLDVSEADRARVHAPAGLDIGARTAPEVALSILAEIVATRSASPRVEAGPASSPVVAGDVATDPVCGMDVAVTADALRVEYGGRTWYFCGSGCRGAFADAPDRYV
jgi:xanthine dehydrogenase accessory factor